MSKESKEIKNTYTCCVLTHVEGVERNKNTCTCCMLTHVEGVKSTCMKCNCTKVIVFNREFSNKINQQACSGNQHRFPKRVVIAGDQVPRHYMRLGTTSGQQNCASLELHL